MSVRGHLAACGIEKAGRSLRRPAFAYEAALRLLRHLAADLAARIGRGVDVDVELAGEQIGGLRIGQRRRALDRAGGRIRDRDRDAGVLAGLGRPVEVGGCCRAGQTGIGDLPGQLLAGGIIVQIGGSGAAGGGSRAPRTCRRALLSAFRRRRGLQKLRRPARPWR